MEKHSDESKDCCKDVSVRIKAGDAHTFFQLVHEFNLHVAIIPVLSFKESQRILPGMPTENLYLANSPPLLNNPLFLMFRNFRV